MDLASHFNVAIDHRDPSRFHRHGEGLPPWEAVRCVIESRVTRRQARRTGTYEIKIEVIVNLKIDQVC
jgi:hypothetical protein